MNIPDTIWLGKELPPDPSDRNIKIGGFGVVTLLPKNAPLSCIKYMPLLNDTLSVSQLSETSLRIEHKFLVCQHGHKIISLAALDPVIQDGLSQVKAKIERSDTRARKLKFSSVLAIGFDRCKGPDLSTARNTGEIPPEVFFDCFMLNSFFFYSANQDYCGRNVTCNNRVARKLLFSQ